jgi:hypothetical protein
MSLDCTHIQYIAININDFAIISMKNTDSFSHS